MGTVFALLAAISFGCGDFLAGLGSRHLGAGVTAAVIQFLGIIFSLVLVVFLPGQGLNGHVLIWGALAGVGNAMGTMVLYRGFAMGQMSVVAPLSGVVTVLLPVLIGLVLGEHLSLRATLGIAVAVPAICMVSIQRKIRVNSPKQHTGVWEGIVSGICFSGLFIALNQAGTESGAWPIVANEIAAFLLVLPFGWKVFKLRFPDKSSIGLILGAGWVSFMANMLFLLATGHGKLAVVAVLASLYPAFTVLLARFVLKEYWSWQQLWGLVATFVSIGLIGAG